MNSRMTSQLAVTALSVATSPDVRSIPIKETIHMNEKKSTFSRARMSENRKGEVAPRYFKHLAKVTAAAIVSLGLIATSVANASTGAGGGGEGGGGGGSANPNRRIYLDVFDNVSLEFEDGMPQVEQGWGQASIDYFVERAEERLRPSAVADSRWLGFNGNGAFSNNTLTFEEYINIQCSTAIEEAKSRNPAASDARVVALQFSYQMWEANMGNIFFPDIYHSIVPSVVAKNEYRDTVAETPAHSSLTNGHWSTEQQDLIADTDLDGTPTHAEYDVQPSEELPNPPVAQIGSELERSLDLALDSVDSHVGRFVSCVALNNLEPTGVVPSPVVTPVAPALVPSDECEVEATVSTPQVAGVSYSQTREGNVVTVTATALEGYVIADGATTTWTFTIPEAEECEGPVEPSTVVTPVAPALVPSDECEVEATVSTPQVAGVSYSQTREGNVVTVTATALEGYVIADGATTTWTFTIPEAVACINDSDDTINDSDDTINDSDDTINDSEVSPTSLTKTGGEGSTAIVGAGLALLTLGAAAGLVGRRRKIEG